MISRRALALATLFSAAVWLLVVLALWRAFTRVAIPEPPPVRHHQHSNP